VMPASLDVEGLSCGDALIVVNVMLFSSETAATGERCKSWMVEKSMFVLMIVLTKTKITENR
jgi:hypothetical protein